MRFFYRIPHGFIEAFLTLIMSHGDHPGHPFF